MERFVHMSLDDLDLLVSGEGCELDDVAYPPRCNPPRGPLRVRAHDRGGIKLEVSRRRLPLDDFVLSVLFQTGSCIFGGSEDLARFFRGSIAKAFGIESEPIPPRFTPEPADERGGSRPTSRRCPGVVRARERRPSCCRLRPSSRPACAAHPRTGRRGGAGCACRRDAPGEGATGAARERAPRRADRHGQDLDRRAAAWCAGRARVHGRARLPHRLRRARARVRPSPRARSAAELHRLRGGAAARRRTAHARLHPPPRRDREGGRGGARRLPRPCSTTAGSRRRTARPSRRPERSWR